MVIIEDEVVEAKSRIGRLIRSYCIFYKRESFPNGSNYISQLGWHTDRELEMVIRDWIIILRPNAVWLYRRANQQWYEVGLVRGGPSTAGINLGAHFCNQDQVTVKCFTLHKVDAPFSYEDPGLQAPTQWDYWEGWLNEKGYSWAGSDTPRDNTFSEEKGGWLRYTFL